MLRRHRLLAHPPARTRSPRRRSRGQAVVEFALILPVFLLFTLGVVDMARIFTAYIALTNGVSNAAIYAGQGGYTKWCSSTSPLPAGDLTCPPAAVALQKSVDPDNIAYQIKVEAVGLTSSAIVMSVPTCTIASSVTVPPATENCTQTAVGVYSYVRIGATYNVGLLLPLLSNIIGGPVHLSAATTAAVQ